MKKLCAALIIGAAGAAVAAAQPPAKKPAAGKRGPTNSVKPKPAKTAIPAVVPVAESDQDRGSVSGRTYSNRALGFEVTFPITWLSPCDDFEAEMKKAGFDLSLSPPPGVTGVDRARLNKALQQVDILLTAYRSMPGATDNAIVRISVEDLATNPQIRDAVDYFDAMRAQFRSMKLPPDFKYSETQAEQLGKQQFGFLDSTSSAGKKRIYATVRNGQAILFTISYSSDEDLQVFRKVLSEGIFSLK